MKRERVDDSISKQAPENLLLLLFLGFFKKPTESCSKFFEYEQSHKDETPTVEWRRNVYWEDNTNSIL